MRHDRLLRQLVRERFVFTLKSGVTFDGLLDDHDVALLDIIDAYLVNEKARVAVDGHLYLPRAEVAYMQRLPR